MIPGKTAALSLLVVGSLGAGVANLCGEEPWPLGPFVKDDAAWLADHIRDEMAPARTQAAPTGDLFV